MPAPYWIEPGTDDLSFPDVSLALRDPDGLLAIGGDLSCNRIISAYQQGIFPWFSEGQPILWWSPDPRFVLFPEKLKISRSLQKTIKKNLFSITINEGFESVIEQCSKTSRAGQTGTWITQDMQQAYVDLHNAGFAYSVEAWKDQQLVGGLYGIAIGRVFFGESMFSHENDASKVAFSYFVHYLQSIGFKLIDCQVYTGHLESLGAQQVPRRDFINFLNEFLQPGKLSGKIIPQTIDIPIRK